MANAINFKNWCNENISPQAWSRIVLRCIPEIREKGLDWNVLDNPSDKLELDGNLSAGNVLKVPMNYKFRLLNTGGTIVLKNTHGEVVDREVYSKQQASVQDWAVRF